MLAFSGTPSPSLPPPLPLHAQTGTTRWCYTVRALWSIVDARSERVLFRNNAVVCKHSWKQCGRNLTFRDSWSLLLVPRPNVYTTRCKLCPRFSYDRIQRISFSREILEYIYILLDYSIYIYIYTWNGNSHAFCIFQLAVNLVAIRLRLTLER